MMPAPDRPPGRMATAAAAIVAELSERLADHAVVRMTAERNTLISPDGSRQPSWSALSLADGYPALALLYAELGHRDPWYRKIAHTYLGRAVANATDAPPEGLYAGPVALAFAASCAARRPGEYRGLLEPLDRSIDAWVPARLRDEWERLDAGRAGSTFGFYDVVTGLTGVGRYLLRRGGESRSALTEILSYLTALTRPCAGAPHLPGWWVAHPPHLVAPAGNGHGGHANLGLAHGISGPLALLSLAWRAGVRVPGQDDAIARIVDWLLEWCIADPAGPDWPATLESTDLAGSRARPPPSRNAWCYGVPGVARAIQLAGQAVDVPGWTAVATAAIRSMLYRSGGPSGVHDAGLCHGWAGLLHVTRLVGMESRDAQVVDAATGLAARVVDCYDNQGPFGFRASNPPFPATADRAGFLEGAAGIALALLSYLDGGYPATGWDNALLVR